MTDNPTTPLVVCGPTCGCGHTYLSNLPKCPNCGKENFGQPKASTVVASTPLPVQGPAGAVEAIMALADAYAEAAQRGEDAMSIARKCSALRSALASLPPVTQAKSEAVAVVQRGAQTPWGFAGVLVSWEPGLQDLPPGKHPLYAAPQEAAERQPLTRELALLLAAKVDLARDYNNDGDVQSTRREDADITDSVLAFAQAIEHFHGIGPATQEKQHG